MEFVALFVFLFALALVLAIASKHPIHWVREEWERIRADEFAPRRPGISGGTIAEPRVKKMDERMRAYAKRLRRDGRHLIAGKRYIPDGTKPSEPPATRSGNVLPIRKPTRITRGD